MVSRHGRSMMVQCTQGGAVVLSRSATVTKLDAPGVHVWFATIDSLRPHLTRLGTLLDPVESDRAARFRLDADRERFILGHGLLRTLIGAYLQRDGSLVRMARGPYGKPYLERKDLRFSFSDTKDAILVAFAQGVEIGADLETMNRKVDHGAVSQHYFTTSEIAAIDEAGEDGLRRFLEFWTRKEAVLKASGVGIMDDLRVLRVDAPMNAVLIEHEAFVKLAAPEYHVFTAPIGSTHVISIAAPTPLSSIAFHDASALLLHSSP